MCLPSSPLSPLHVINEGKGYTKKQALLKLSFRKYVYQKVVFTKWLSVLPPALCDRQQGQFVLKTLDLYLPAIFSLFSTIWTDNPQLSIPSLAV